MEWRASVIIPIYKEKGDVIQDFGNYRGIKLMSHTIKIWIMDRRLREETT